jgi:hypothetical protein
MALTFQQILIATYPAQFKAGLFTLTSIDGQIVIDIWNVPGVARPTYDEIMALDTPSLEASVTIEQFFDQATPVVKNYINSVAMARKYEDAVTCISYYNSTNSASAADAQTFMAWRDSVKAYIAAQEALILSGGRELPASMAALIAELPAIVWPN